MAFLRFLFAMGLVTTGFFIGGSVAGETEGAVVGAGLGLIVALTLINFWRVLLNLAVAGACG